MSTKSSSSSSSLSSTTSSSLQPARKQAKMENRSRVTTEHQDGAAYNIWYHKFTGDGEDEHRKKMREERNTRLAQVGEEGEINEEEEKVREKTRERNFSELLSRLSSWMSLATVGRLGGLEWWARNPTFAFTSQEVWRKCECVCEREKERVE